MRKVLIATIVAMVLFAVGAFAATFLLSDEPLASDTAAVVACDTPKVSFNVGAYDGTDWPVTGAAVTEAEQCADGTTVEVVILNNTTPVASGTATLTAGAATIDFDPDTSAAGPINNYAVRLGGVLVGP